MFEDGIGAADMGKDKIGKLHGTLSLLHPQPCRNASTADGSSGG
jgi:hypothetical protein